MPLPVRAASVRTNTAENKKPLPSRSVRPSPRVSEAKPKDDESSKAVNISPPNDAVFATSVNTKECVHSGQASSRIPSPLKRNPSSLSSHTLSTNTSHLKSPAKGHGRQRSAALPNLSSQQKFAHARSRSIVSNTTSTSSNDTRPVLNSRFDATQHLSSSTKSKPSSQQQSNPTTTFRSGATLSQVELIQNELLQLSAVHYDSVRTLAAYQRSVGASLATKAAELTSAHDAILEQKKAFSKARNLSAVDSWLQIEGPQRAAQSLQNLSVAVRDLRSLEGIFDGPDGLASAFEKWQSNVIQTAPDVEVSLHPDKASAHILYEQQLSPNLRRFKHQVTSSKSVLENLPQCPSDSSLHHIVQGHVVLATNLLMVCQLMLQTGEYLTYRHRQWLEGEVDAALEDAESPKPLESAPLMFGQ